MYNHAPENYVCPFCSIAAGQEIDGIYTKQTDVALRDDWVTAFISAAWWPRNAGHIIVIPNQHYENIYDLPLEIASQIHRAAREIALALKAVYLCDGISTRQHNEPFGDQEIWHYHLHVFPRYQGDQLYGSQRRFTTPDERLPYARKLREFLKFE